MALLQKVADKIMEESESRKNCVDKAKEFIKRINWLRTAKFMAPVATGIITGGAVAGPVGSFIGAVSGLLGQSGMPSQEECYVPSYPLAPSTTDPIYAQDMLSTTSSKRSRQRE